MHCGQMPSVSVAFIISSYHHRHHHHRGERTELRE